MGECAVDRRIQPLAHFELIQIDWADRIREVSRIPFLSVTNIQQFARILSFMSETEETEFSKQYLHSMDDHSNVQTYHTVLLADVASSCFGNSEICLQGAIGRALPRHHFTGQTRLPVFFKIWLPSLPKHTGAAVKPNTTQEHRRRREGTLVSICALT